MLSIRYPSKSHKYLRTFFDKLKLIPFLILIKNRSYSQYGEDNLLNQLLGDQKGSYVDIGAGLPCWGSNTYSLYRRGWQGVLIDPIDRNIRLARFFRRRDKSLCAAVGKEEDFLDFYVFQPYELSTLSYEVYIKQKEGNFGEFKIKQRVPVLPLSKILAGMKLDRPLIFSIDTEGYELQVLESNDWKECKPDIICIEEWNNPILTETEVKRFLENMNYSLIMYNGISSFYISNDSKLN